MYKSTSLLICQISVYPKIDLLIYTTLIFHFPRFFIITSNQKDFKNVVVPVVKVHDFIKVKCLLVEDYLPLCVGFGIWLQMIIFQFI